MSDSASELSREELLQRYSQLLPSGSAAVRRSPFKFLDSYEASDADIFFGREFEIKDLLWHFQSYGHVLIYGESGSGKSSLVQCGLRSRIPEADALFIPLRVHTTGLPGLCEQIRESASVTLSESLESAVGLPLVDTLRAVGEAASRPIVLFFDQFEELFIFHSLQVRRRFAEELASIVPAKLNVKVIIGVRQDFLAQSSELENVLEGLFNNRFWLRRMSRETAAQAVVMACDARDVKIDAQLANSILQRLDPGGQGIELPYLQVVMDRLYRQAIDDDPDQPVITTEKVDQLGDVANILGTFLVEEVAKLPAPDIGRQMLKAFVTREKTRRTLDQPSLANAAAGFGAAIPPEVLSTHLQQLASARIIRETADTGSYELRHDALAATVSSWISEVEKELIEVRDNLINRFNEYTARGGQASALLDQGFMDYLAVYRKRLGPLLNDSQSQYLRTSEQRLRRARKFRQFATASGIAASLFAVIGAWMYLQFRDAKQAREKEAIATKHLSFAKKAVKGMLSEVGADTLKDVPQMESVRAVLLDNALTLFKDIGAEDEAGRFEMAVAQYQVGEIHRILGTEDDAKAAEIAYREAIDQLEVLCREFPDKTLYRHQLGLAHMWLGELFRETDKVDRTDDAKRQYDKAIKIQFDLAYLADENKNKNKNLYEIDLARSYMNRGIQRKDNALRKRNAQDVEGEKQNFADAKSDNVKAESLLTKVANALTSERKRDQAELSDSSNNGEDQKLFEECHILLSKTHLNRGVQLKSQLDINNLDRNLFTDAKNSYFAALDELHKVVRKRRKDELPERLEYNLDLAKYHNNIANLLLQFDPVAKEEASVHNAQAVALGKSLNVGTRQVRMDLANFYNTRAQSFADENKTAEAITQWQIALDTLDTVLSENEEDAGAKNAKIKYQSKMESIRNAEPQETPNR